jgi:hypothetical protein
MVHIAAIARTSLVLAHAEASNPFDERMRELLKGRVASSVVVFLSGVCRRWRSRPCHLITDHGPRAPTSWPDRHRTAASAEETSANQDLQSRWTATLAQPKGVKGIRLPDLHVGSHCAGPNAIAHAGTERVRAGVCLEGP